METLEAINERASLKTRLSARDVEHEKIVKILDAARLDPRQAIGSRGALLWSRVRRLLKLWSARHSKR